MLLDSIAAEHLYPVIQSICQAGTPYTAATPLFSAAARRKDRLSSSIPTGLNIRKAMTAAIASSASGGALHQQRLSPINPQGDGLFQVCVLGHYQKRFNSVSQEYTKTNQNGFVSLGPVLKLFTYFKMTTLFPVDPVLGQEMGSFHSVPMIVHLCEGLDCI